MQNSAKTIIYLGVAILLISCYKEDESLQLKTFSDFIFEEPTTSGVTYYIDPINGSPSGDGSKNKPWRILQEVIDSNLVQFYSNSDTYGNNTDLMLNNTKSPVKEEISLFCLVVITGISTLTLSFSKTGYQSKQWMGTPLFFLRLSLQGLSRKSILKDLLL